MNFDTRDPELYDKRFELTIKESYQREHWQPLIERAIKKYCSNESVCLDLGCGTGAYFMTLLQKYSNNVLGLDNSIRFLKYGKQKYRNNNLILGDAYQVPLRDESVDIIISNMFEYVDRNYVVTEVYRILRSNGICIIFTPNKYSASRIPFKIIAKLLRRKRDINEASLSELKQAFNKFEMLECKMNDGLIWLPSFVDKFCGRKVYAFVEAFFKIRGANPFSNMMLFVARKG